ncbi:MAG TPA: hypothetical protein VJO35_10995 [Terriglobales bacterium]|nr:hypothetical protein [Terriglobales bacterium]
MTKKIHIVLLLAILVAGVRLGIILYERHEASVVPAKKAEPLLNPDYYVSPKKLYPYDVKSAKQLMKQPVWVKVGYAYPYYAYDFATHHVTFSHEAGKLGPLQRLEVKDVVTGVSPEDPGERQVLAVFGNAGKTFATPIGQERGGDYKFFSDDMFYIEDPHQLYKHWPADVWQAIDQHQVKSGMNELQVDCAIGIGLLESGGDEIDRTLDYPNGGKPLTISFHGGKATEIKPGSPS